MDFIVANKWINLLGTKLDYFVKTWWKYKHINRIWNYAIVFNSWTEKMEYKKE